MPNPKVDFTHTVAALCKKLYVGEGYPWFLKPQHVPDGSGTICRKSEDLCSGMLVLNEKLTILYWLRLLGPRGLVSYSGFLGHVSDCT